MALTYDWKLTGLKKQHTDSLENVVIGTRWQIKGIDENGYSGSFAGATPFELKSVETGSFIPYEELTEEIVIGWVEAEVQNTVKYPVYWNHINERILNEISESKYVSKEVHADSLPWYTGSIEGDAPPV